jgi:DNA mismatch repair protein MutS2
MSHIIAILRRLEEDRLGPRALVLLDELGAGTDPQEGSALARAILEHLRQRRVCCVATTHYSDLKLYAHAAPRVENASVEFDPHTLRPTYRLLVGLPGRSNALEVAAQLGVPGVILERARASLDPASVEAGRLLDQIQQERQAAREARQQAERERQAAARARASLERELAEAQRDRQEAWSQAEDTSREMLTDLRREITALQAEARRSRAELSAGSRQALAAVDRLETQAGALAPVTAPASIRAAPPPPAPLVEEPEAPRRALAPGVEVMVPSLGVPGTIVRLDPDEAELDVRGMRVRLKRSELAAARPLSGRERSAAREAATRVVLDTPGRPVALQLDLRGQRRDEAVQELDRYLNDAYLAGLKTVRVVHGKGTGAVRQAVHELLGGHPLVRRFAAAPREAGGEGATEVELVAS